ncbi:hypothetical protein B8W99_11820 [Peribacillus simplex]|nr:hypothetical protein B8W99_11820 [Peribacillus simplex]
MRLLEKCGKARRLRDRPRKASALNGNQRPNCTAIKKAEAIASALVCRQKGAWKTSLSSKLKFRTY